MANQYQLGYTTESFIAKAREIHGDKYDYSPTNYVNGHADVIIICPKHGEFSIRASRHLSGKGCQKCSYEASKRNEKELIESFNLIHGGKYDYSKMKYKRFHANICVICPIHGEFEIAPNSHLSGRGCPKCARDNQMNNRKVYGVGVNDVYNSAHSPYQRTWARMIERCFDPKYKAKEPSYEECTMCEEWLTLSNFKRWFEDTANGYKKGYQLDKDILVKGNKVYGPDTCCFVPGYINTLLINCKSKRGKYPIGVSKLGNRYSANISHNKEKVHLGYFSTPEEAFYAYKADKESYIKEVATAYYNEGKITKKVYEALMNWTIEITD